MKAFSFTLPSSSGKLVSLSDFKGKYVVLYFYPRDNTPGCTVEAIDFTRLRKDFEKLNCVIVGVSSDSPKSHCGFIEKQKLNLILLSDEKKEVMKKLGVYGKKMLYGKEIEGVIRSTFLISPKGEIIKEWRNVKANEHAEKVLEKLRSLALAR